MNFDRNAARNAASSPSHRAQARSTAAVPISVYRELAAELQATQVMLDAMQGQNQHLRKQNLHLQQEVDSIVQAAKKMQSLVGGAGGEMPPSSVADTAAQAVSSQPQASHPSQRRQGMRSQPNPLHQSPAARPPAAVPSAASSPAAVPPIARPQPQAGPPPAMPPRISEPPSAQEMPVTPQNLEPLAIYSAISPEALARPEALSSQDPSALSIHPEEKAAGPGPLFSLPQRQDAVAALNKIFTGREQPLPRRSLEEGDSQELSMGWLVVIVLFVVVTAFGTGFVIVRPFLSPNR